jgi:hypothetical protein
MKEFIFKKQVSIELYRKWFILEKKNPQDFLDRQQVLDLKNIILDQTSVIIDSYCENKLVLLNDEIPIGQKNPFFRCEFPILYLDFKKFKKIILKLLIIDNSIECLNVPGCIVEGENLNDAFNNLILAVIECFNIRSKNGMYFTNRVFPIKTYWNFNQLESEEYVKELKNDGWSNEFYCPFHTILLNNSSQVTYTIPHNKIISGSLRFAFKRYQFVTDGSSYRRWYQ